MARFAHSTLGMTVLALAAACGSQTAGQSTTGGEGGSPIAGTTGVGGAITTTATTTTSSITAVSGAGGFGGSGGGAPDGCDPPPPAGSVWSLSAESWPMLDPAAMCKYRGDVLLIVNTAAI